MKTRRAEDFSNRDYTLMELRVPASVYSLLDELAKYRGEDVANMSLNMLLEELDGELKNDSDMGQTLAKYLRRKHSFKEDDA